MMNILIESLILLFITIINRFFNVILSKCDFLIKKSIRRIQSLFIFMKTLYVLNVGVPILDIYFILETIYIFSKYLI